jgi:hypothetical protein
MEYEELVFMVGMPRSDTTLMEQILSSHSQNEETRELLFWRARGRPLQNEWVLGASPVASSRSLAQAFVKLLRGFAPTATRITDKMPINFLFIRIIHTLLPRTKFIPCKRNAVDTCLSVYMARYVMPPEFANSRNNRLFGYKQYSRLMAHWRDVLSPTTFLEYEKIVKDRETEAHKMIAFCGMEWDEACVRHENNQKSVMTPSLWQARQPVYTTSVEPWRKYEPWLGEFRQLLDSV